MKHLIKAVVFVIVGLCVVLSGGLSVPNADAELVVINQDVLWDSTNSRYWYRDLTDFTGNFQDKVNQVSNLNTGTGFYGLTTWHMATASEQLYNSGYSFDEITNAFVHTNLEDRESYWEYWWDGIYDYQDFPGTHGKTSFQRDWDFALSEWMGPAVRHYWTTGDDIVWPGAWVTTDVVPIPPTEFGPDSADITNQYTPFRLGTRSIRMGCNGTPNEGELFYLDAVGTENLFGIKCLKVNVVSEGRLVTLWLAQDTDGTVWVLKVHFHGIEETYLFGSGIQSPFMPAVPSVDTRVGLTFPESEEYFCKITETGLDRSENCWGQGPFSECIKVQCGQPPDLSEEVEYFCPGSGNVEDLSTELKEIVGSSCISDLDKNGVVDGFDLATFAAEFGNTCD